MNELLGVLLFSVGMSVAVPAFFGFLRRISPDGDTDPDFDSDSFVLRPKKGVAFVVGTFWNVVWSGWVYLVYTEVGWHPVLIIIWIGFLCVGFSLIISEIPGVEEVRVTGERIFVKRLSYKREFTFDDIQSYRYIGRAGTWIVKTKLKSPKRLIFDCLTVNAERFVEKLEEHGIQGAQTL